MTREDYKLIAAAICDAQLDQQSNNALIHALCTRFKQDNPRFDHIKFYAACLASAVSPDRTMQKEYIGNVYSLAKHRR